MPTLNLTTELSINDLLFVISKLNDDEFAKFEAGLQQLKATRHNDVDKEAAHIAAQHRLSSSKQVRLNYLLWKNKETELTPEEADEMEAYFAELDQALEHTTEALFKLAAHRQSER